jgi:hypothetical protein
MCTVYGVREPPPAVVLAQSLPSKPGAARAVVPRGRVARGYAAKRAKFTDGAAIWRLVGCSKLVYSCQPRPLSFRDASSIVHVCPSMFCSFCKIGPKLSHVPHGTRTSGWGWQLHRITYWTNVYALHSYFNQDTQIWPTCHYTVCSVCLLGGLSTSLAPACSQPCMRRAIRATARST